MRRLTQARVGRRRKDKGGRRVPAEQRGSDLAQRKRGSWKTEGWPTPSGEPSSRHTVARETSQHSLTQFSGSCRQLMSWPEGNEGGSEGEDEPLEDGG